MKLPVRAHRACSLAALALFSAAGLAQAQTATTENLYLKLAGVTGDLTAPTARAGWIAADDLAWSVHADASYLKGTGAAVGKAQASVLSWSQGFDSSMGSLYQHIIKGVHYSDVTLEQTRTSARGTAATALTIVGTNTFVTDLSMGMNGLAVSALPKQLSLSVNTGAWGVPNRTVTADWNIATNQITTSNRYAAVAPNSLTGRHAAATDSTVHAYMRLETPTGDSLAGFSTAYGYENWIEVSNAGWDLSAAISSSAGTGSAVGKATPGAFSWTQDVDATLPLALDNIVRGTRLGRVVIEYVRVQGQGAPVTFMQQTLHDAFYTDIALAGGTVSQSMIFKSIDQIQWAVDATTGQRGRASGFTFNVATNLWTQNSVATQTQATHFGSGLLNGNWAESGIPMAAQSAGNPLPSAPVPEPQSWLLMLAGGALLAGLARRRAMHRG